MLVNNAGGDPLRQFDEMAIEENLAILDLNLTAPIALTHLVLPGMLERGRGHIVNISAMAGRVSFPFTEAYAAAKDGVIGFTRVLRSDFYFPGMGPWMNKRLGVDRTLREVQEFRRTHKSFA